MYRLDWTGLNWPVYLHVILIIIIIESIMKDIPDGDDPVGYSTYRRACAMDSFRGGPPRPFVSHASRAGAGSLGAHSRRQSRTFPVTCSCSSSTTDGVIADWMLKYYSMYYGL
jgi:hypothetical protein